MKKPVTKPLVPRAAPVVYHKPEPWYHTHRAPDRPGSMDAFKLPSVINGNVVPVKTRPTAIQGADVI